MRKLKTKTIPCLVMLIGAVATLAITYYNHYTSRETLEVLLISLLACYFIGTLVKTALDRIEIPIPLEELEETEELEDSDNVVYHEDDYYDDDFEESNIDNMGIMEEYPEEFTDESEEFFVEDSYPKDEESEETDTYEEDYVSKFEEKTLGE